MSVLFLSALNPSLTLSFLINLYLSRMQILGITPATIPKHLNTLWHILFFLLFLRVI